MIKVRDEVTPKKFPSLKSKVKRIDRDFNDEPLYVLENNTLWTKNDLK